MKTALIHYWLTNLRGGEKVLQQIAALYPDADIFTHACRRALMEPLFEGHKIIETFIGRLPGAQKHCQRFLPLMPAALNRLDLSAYDLIISSESGPAKGIRKPAGARHICYCHTPMRYLWDMYEEYYRSAGLTGKLAMRLFRDHLRDYDVRSAKSVDLFIANSAFVAERIRRIYHRDSAVVHPPVDFSFFSAGKSEKKDYYLWVGQLTDYKRPELALEACRRLKRKLVIVGTGNLENRLRKEAGPEVEFRGKCSSDELRECYAGARALLFPGLEDFGIVPLEAQSAGTPVIAFGAGGVLETVREGITGVFFQRQDAESLTGAMLDAERMSFSPERCRENASKFTPENFRAAFQKACKNA